MNVQGTQQLTKTIGRKQDAPFAQLPNEILIPIFLEANFEPSSVWRVVTKTGKRSREEGAWVPCNMAVVISHVCQRWRYISLGIPALWTTFYYVEYRSNTREILQRLDAYLERSGTHLLDIWINLRGSRHNLVDRNQSLITKTIVHVNRWRSFTFFPDNTLPLLLTFKFFTQLKHLAAPNLETFCITADFPGELRSALGLPITYGQASNTPGSSLIFKKGAPKLSVVCMGDSGFFVNCLPLSNASTLYIFNEDPAVQRIPAVFWLLSMKSPSNLTHLTLDRVVIGDHPSTSSWPPLVVFPRLMHFRLYNLSIYRSEFSRFQFPLLETLTLYKVDYEDDQENRPVDIPNLHSLFLVDSNIPDNGISLTRLTSTITTIVLSDSRMPSAGIQPMELLDYDHTQQGWPILQDITINLWNTEKFGLEFYLRCFQTRPQVPPITLRIDPNLLADWQTRIAARLALLEGLCTIETLDASNPYIPSPWPIDTLDGPFGNLYEKLHPPLIKRFSTYYSDT